MNQSLYKSSSKVIESLFTLNTFLMLIISLRLTKYYIDIQTFTEFNFFYSPLSILGIFVSLSTLLGMIRPSKNYEEIIALFTFLNVVVYSLIAIFLSNSLEEYRFMLWLYIFSSIFQTFLFFKYGQTFKRFNRHFFLLLISLLSFQLVSSFGFHQYEIAIKNHFKKQTQEILNRKKVNMPKIESEFKIISNPNAKIKIVIFSDFECPACSSLSSTIKSIKNKYQEVLDIQYYFYPLDKQCNISLTDQLHENACKAARIAICSPRKSFEEIHDELYANQNKFKEGFLDILIKSKSIDECVNSLQTKETTYKYIQVGDENNVRMTPSILINGIKIEGQISAVALSLIIEDILKK